MSRSQRRHPPGAENDFDLAQGMSVIIKVSEINDMREEIGSSANFFTATLCIDVFDCIPTAKERGVLASGHTRDLIETQTTGA